MYMSEVVLFYSIFPQLFIIIPVYPDILGLIASTAVFGILNVPYSLKWPLWVWVSVFTVHQGILFFPFHCFLATCACQAHLQEEGSMQLRRHTNSGTGTLRRCVDCDDILQWQVFSRDCHHFRWMPDISIVNFPSSFTVYKGSSIIVCHRLCNKAQVKHEGQVTILNQILLCSSYSL